ncbi:unnamed protein product, partial [Strongylus vulgaris]
MGQQVLALKSGSGLRDLGEVWVSRLNTQGLTVGVGHEIEGFEKEEDFDGEEEEEEEEEEKEEDEEEELERIGDDGGEGEEDDDLD